jgi:hypothetical protein
MVHRYGVHPTKMIFENIPKNTQVFRSLVHLFISSLVMRRRKKFREKTQEYPRAEETCRAEVASFLAMNCGDLAV